MITLEDLLLVPVALLEQALEKLHSAHAALSKRREDSVQVRINQSHQGHGDFKEEELVYAAYKLCACGHGMAYPEGTGAHGSWDCSAILKGVADTEVTHSGEMPFTFWSVRSESQIARNNGLVTTRPRGAAWGPHMEQSIRQEKGRRAQYNLPPLDESQVAHTAELAAQTAPNPA